MTTLHERLADLAEAAPTDGLPPDLWDRGRRAAHRQRLGAAAIVAAMVLAVVALGTADWLQSRPTPAPANGTPALPDRLWTPGRWLPGTDDAGELGQLAAVQAAERGGWTGSGDGYVGISAATGEYRFLDLPDASHDVVALSPDGLHVAYWYTGETRLSPNSGTGPVVGVAVYDTTTGEIVRHAVGTDHGLMVEDLVWADAARLVFHYLQYRGGDGDDDMAQSSGDDESGLLVWRPGAEEDPAVIREVGGGLPVEASTGHGQLLLSNDEAVVWLDLDDPEHWVRLGLPALSYRYVSAVDDDGTRVATVLGNANPNSISVARRGDGSTPTLVPHSSRTFAVRAWLDEHHVAAVRRVGSGMAEGAMFSVDVRTGASTELLRFPPNTYGTTTQLATDLLHSPTVTRPEPPHPFDPRAVAAGELLLVAGGFLTLVLWRRRRVDA